MERNTVLAIVLSVIVITIGFTVQNILYPPVPPTDASAADAPAADGDQPTVAGDGSGPAPATSAPAPAGAIRSGTVIAVGSTPDRSEPVTYRNDLMEVTFDPAGARVVSMRLLDHLDGGEPVEMVVRGETGRAAFELAFGNDLATPVTDRFRRVDTTERDTVIFERDFAIVGAEEAPFTVRRIYRFYPGEYLFEVSTEFENSVNAVIPLDANGDAYSISFGPQIGPSYIELDNRNEYRRFHYYNDDRRRDLRTRVGAREILEEDASWFALAGKYFAVIVVPDATQYQYVGSLEAGAGLEDGATMYVTRPTMRSAANRDTLRFYVGPKSADILDRYNRADDNSANVRNLDLDAIQDRRILFGWLESLLKVVLQLIYRVIPNYGVAIILLTILVKIALFPLTHKSYESTAKMQALNPQLTELRTKHKDNPQKLNQAMSELYKKEGVNPLGGCLPIAAQFPFFIAMFGLFNNHFDLRGATFISGWINDLSAPESIWNFGEFTLPLLGWNDLRLLPIVFLASQLISGLVMQNPSTAGTSNTQMKFMQFGMPIMFFFILYDMPSGLLVYWIFSNVLTVLQQTWNNSRRTRRIAE